MNLIYLIILLLSFIFNVEAQDDTVPSSGGILDDLPIISSVPGQEISDLPVADDVQGTIDETVSGAQDAIDETVSGAQGVVDETVSGVEDGVLGDLPIRPPGTDVQGTIDETVSGAQDVIDETVSGVEDGVLGDLPIRPPGSDAQGVIDETVSGAQDAIDETVSDTQVGDVQGTIDETVSGAQDGVLGDLPILPPGTDVQGTIDETVSGVEDGVLDDLPIRPPGTDVQGTIDETVSGVQDGVLGDLPILPPGTDVQGIINETVSGAQGAIDDPVSDIQDVIAPAVEIPVIPVSDIGDGTLPIISPGLLEPITNSSNATEFDSSLESIAIVNSIRNNADEIKDYLNNEFNNEVSLDNVIRVILLADFITVYGDLVFGPNITERTISDYCAAFINQVEKATNRTFDSCSIPDGTNFTPGNVVTMTLQSIPTSASEAVGLFCSLSIIAFSVLSILLH